MKSIGLDIGTTTICGIVLDGNTGIILETITLENNSFINGTNSWERLQDPLVILEKVKLIIDTFKNNHKQITNIGVTGQMHGILYLNEKGNPVSPLYTWQDGRGDLLYKENQSYAQVLSNTTGLKVATGFGSVTHFYNFINNTIPTDVKNFCTISDFIAMKLSNTTKPLIHPSNAASIGLYDLEKNEFDLGAIRSLGMETSFFPEVATENQGTNIIAIGDNQASFLGAVKNNDDCLSINIGTSSQISIYTKEYYKHSPIDIRPFVGGGFLFVGSPLCGGRSYAILEEFFKSVVKMSTGQDVSGLFEIMNKYAVENLLVENKLNIITKFSGTRQDPLQRGSINNLGVNNFTPEHFIIGTLEGIVNELFETYQLIKPMLAAEPKRIICSGNGIRLNKTLQIIITKVFDLPLSIPLYKEEAAYGAALFSQKYTLS